MKALVYERYGPRSRCASRRSTGPTPGKGEVLVKVRAVSLNASDWETLHGKPLYARIGGPRRPRFRTLGSDIAGLVETNGPGATRFAPGDEVFGDNLARIEPFRKLDSFCQEVRSLLAQNTRFLPEWQTSTPPMPQGFRTFIERQDADSLYTSMRKETMSKRILAASKLEDESARVFLRTARNAHEEGYAAKLLTGHTESQHVPIQRLEDAGLVEREVQISCRKTGHALFRLPNPHALAVVTVSDATCSECGAPVADENVEEVIAPTQLASSLLEDGSWLVSRIHCLLREMGVPEREIAVGPAEGTGYGQLMANICGESFLIVTRDGDLTPAFRVGRSIRDRDGSFASGDRRDWTDSQGSGSAVAESFETSRQWWSGF